MAGPGFFWARRGCVWRGYPPPSLSEPLGYAQDQWKLSASSITSQLVDALKRSVFRPAGVSAGPIVVGVRTGEPPQIARIGRPITHSLFENLSIMRSKIHLTMV